MSRTVRKHEAPGVRAKRGPKNKPHANKNDEFKTRKQLRARDRESLRREYR